MKKFTLILLLVGLIISPLHAQWYKGIAKGARTRMQNIRRAAVKPLGVTTRQVERAVFRAGVSTPPTRVLKASRAMIPLRDRHPVGRLFSVKATAFVIEEMYKGKRYVWGVTASHYGYRRPAVPIKRFTYEPAPFVAQGHPRGNDVSIFRIPESVAGQFEPLKLAPHSPEVGEGLFSLSFFDNAFQYTPGRKVLTTTPLRFTTTVNADLEIAREGECGSPLINKNGEVAGMVVGASYRRQIGYAVPVEQIRQLLRAYHEHNSYSIPLRLYGEEIFHLDINEAITRIAIKYKDGTLLEHTTFHREGLVDYEHLENLTDLSNAQEISLTIDRKPFQTPNEGFAPITRQITYNLQTHAVSMKMLP